MYWDAYLADTTHLTTEEHGAYMLLLAAMWRRNGVVPDDDKDNARILGLTPVKWRKIKARLMATISGFIVENDTITQEKLQKTWKNTQEKIDKNKQNGAKGGRAAASNNNDLGQANATVSVKPKSSIPEPEPEPVKKESTNVLLAQSSSFSASDFQDFWDAYPHRNGKKGRPNAEKSFARAIKSGATLEQIAAGVSSMQNDPDVRKGFARDPTTWLNQKGWTDEFDAQQPQSKAINGGRNDQARNNHTEYHSDPALEHIAHLAGVIPTSGNGRF
jgi:uncharacterized protein YdaU (DUF1376 family)